MKGLTLTVVFTFIVSLSLPAWAQEKVTPQKAGEPAPFTGLLVPESRFTELLQAELELEKLQRQQKIDKKYILSLEDMYKLQLQKATQPPQWYETPSANRWFGFTIGVALTVLAVYGGTQIVKASGDGR